MTNGDKVFLFGLLTPSFGETGKRFVIVTKSLAATGRTTRYYRTDNFEMAMSHYDSVVIEKPNHLMVVEFWDRDVMSGRRTVDSYQPLVDESYFEDFESDDTEAQSSEE